MVLAAGIGSRLKPYTLHTPKPLIPLLGVPCIEFSLLQLKPLNLNTVVVNVHAHADQMLTYLQNNSPIQGVKVSDESSKLLGSAGGFKKAVSLLESVPGKSEAFFSLNADVVSCIDLKALADRHEELKNKHGVVMTLCLAHGKMLQNLDGSYTEILVNEETGLVSGIGEKNNKVPFYTGTAVFETKAFHHLELGVPAEFSPEVLIPWIQKNKVGFFWMDDLWLDVGSPELWKKSHFELLDQLQLGSLPAAWIEPIKLGMKKGYFGKNEDVVDYDSTHAPSSHHYLSYKGDRLDV